MIDIKLLRENPEQVREAIGKKKFACDLDSILELDKTRRIFIKDAEQLRARQKAANNEMSKLEKGSPEFLKKIKELKVLADKYKECLSQQQAAEEAWQKALLTIPNLPHESVPVGKDEKDNQVLHTWGDPEAASPHARPHYEIPWFQQLVDLPRGTKVTGAGFPFFVGDMAKLVRGLISFFLDEADQAGYVEILPPLVVNAASATATGPASRVIFS